MIYPRSRKPTETRTKFTLSWFRTCVHMCWVASIISKSLQPYRPQSLRLLSPRDSPGKNTGIAMPSSSGSSQRRNQSRVSCVSCIAGRLFSTELPEKLNSEHVMLILTKASTTTKSHSGRAILSSLVQAQPQNPFTQCIRHSLLIS